MKKKILIPMVAAAFAATGSPAHAGIPVVDVTNVAVTCGLCAAPQPAETVEAARVRLRQELEQQYTAERSKREAILKEAGTRGKGGDR